MTQMRQRPQSAMATCGIMARPAGVAGIFASSGLQGQKTQTLAYGQSLKKSTHGCHHALRNHSPYADVAPPQWRPLEAAVQPTWATHGAGCVSGGSIDNTYLPAPLTNAWGKARELATNEVRSMPHKQATDILVRAKGCALPPPMQTENMMNSVRPPYSKTIPLFHPMDPLRTEAGFIRPPNIIPGARAPPPGVLRGENSPPPSALPDGHRLMKLSYDQELSKGASRLPVSRVVNVKAHRPMSAQPRFLKMAAGLPGGLSLTPTVQMQMT